MKNIQQKQVIITKIATKMLGYNYNQVHNILTE